MTGTGSMASTVSTASVERVVVAFHGEGAGDEELAWGQSELFRAMTRQESWFPIGGVRPLDAATTVEDITAELAYLVGRYQTMRTRLRFPAGGRPRQTVHDRGEIVLEVVDAGESDPDEAAQQLRLRYETTPYDFAGEWPVRMGVIRKDGALTHQVSIMCHLVTDAFGGAVMLREVGAGETAPPTGRSSLDQARWQRSPAGTRTNEAALRHWEGALRALTPPRHVSADPRSPRHWQGEFASPAMHEAVRAIAARVQVDTGPIVLALYAIASARVTGDHPVVTRPVVGNRFRPGLAGVVANIAQNSICLLDVAGAVDEAIERVRRTAVVAFKHAYFDPIALDELAARVSEDRGTDVDVRCFFSDRRLPTSTTAPGPDPTPASVRAARSLTTLEWVSKQDNPLETFMLYVENVPDTLRFTVFVDTHYLSPDEMEAVFRAMEDVAVAAAFDPTARTL